MTTLTGQPPSSLPVSLGPDEFMRSVIRELATVIEDVVGLEHATGFISVVGQRIGENLGDQYRNALQTDRLTRDQVAQVVVDLKQKIKGDFYIISQSDYQIVLGARSCPFGDKVLGRPSMCMMTSNVFGTIAAQNLGYAKVQLQQTIATGASGCHVVIHLRACAEVDAVDGREYFNDEA